MTIDAARMRTESGKDLGSDPERVLAFRRVGVVDSIDLSTGDGQCSPRVAECEVLEKIFEYAAVGVRTFNIYPGPMSEAIRIIYSLDMNDLRSSDCLLRFSRVVEHLMIRVHFRGSENRKFC